MDAPTSPTDIDDAPSTEDALSVMAADRLSELMTRHGVPARQHANLLAQVAGMSISQARRKLKGASWSFGEVWQLTRYFGETLDTVFAQALGADAGALPPPQRSTLSAQFIHLGQMLPCEIRLGAQLPAQVRGDQLAAAHDARGWWVASSGELHERGRPFPHYAVDQLVISQERPDHLAHIAVVDDDRHAAEALQDWFVEAGYQAQAFPSAASLLATPLTQYDAFIVDFILGHQTTAHDLIEQIRRACPVAPIVVLTGQLRDGHATEADLTTLLRTRGATFFEKPARPAVLAAAIQSHLDRLAQTDADETTDS